MSYYDKNNHNNEDNEDNEDNSIIDLTLWVNNSKLFKNIRQYLCDENCGTLIYKVIEKQKTSIVTYNHSCAYKSRNYIKFIDSVDKLSVFQKNLKYIIKRSEKYYIC